MTPPTPARRDAATGATTMRTQFSPVRSEPATLRITDVRQGQYRPLDDEEPTMTEPDTTDHVAAIRDDIADVYDEGMEHTARRMRGHLDAIAARLAAAEAERDAERAKRLRWQRYGMAFRDYDDAGGSPERHDALAELEAAEDALVEHGDMDGSDDDAE